MKLTTVYFLVFFSLFASCKKSSDTITTPQHTQLKTDKTNLSLAGTAGSKDSFMIIYDGNWTLELNPLSPWAKLSVTSGTGNTKVFVTSQETDTTNNNRVATITVKSENNSIPISVTITQQPYSAYSWIKYYQGTITKLIPASDGGYIGVGKGQNDVLVVKIDNDGNLLWQKTIGGIYTEYGNDIIKTPDGGYLIAGSYGFSGMPSTMTTTDEWLIKINAAGDVLWDKKYGGTNSDRGDMIIQTTDNNYIIMGTRGNSDQDLFTFQGDLDYLIIKVDPLGNLIWEKTYGGSGVDYGFAIAKGANGGYLATGISRSNDGDVTNHHGSDDIWVIYINENGDLIWQRSYGGSKEDQGTAILANQDGGFTIGGITESSDGDILKPLGKYDAWLFTINSTGSIMWQNSYGGSQFDEMSSLIRTDNGDLLFSGFSQSSDGDVLINRGLWDTWVVRVDNKGNLKSSKTFGSTVSDYAFGITDAGNDNFYMVGALSNATFDAWIMKFKD